MVKILLVSGGSGGHIFPAYALIEELQKRFRSLKIVFVISGRPAEKKILDYIKNKLINIKIVEIPILPFKRENLWNGIISFSNFFKGSIYSFFLNLFLHPNIVIGFGGILSVPLVISAFILRIPTLIHEQNLYPGKANRLLIYFAKKAALSFEESKKYFKQHKKLITTGNPIRPDLLFMDKKESLNILGLNPQFFTILILGGSQGASNINHYFLNIWKELAKKNLDFQLIHITGSKDFSFISEEYKKIRIPARVFDFFENIGLLFSSADLIIGRAGASTLNEISYFAKPAIVIPYSYAEEHQKKNAHYYSQKEAVIAIEEKDLEQKKISELIYDIIKDREKRLRLGEKIKGLNNPLAKKLLAEVVENLLY